MAVIKVTPYSMRHKQIPSLPMKEFDITPSDTDTFENPVMIECLTAGTLVYIPFEGDNEGDKTSTRSKAMAVGDVLNVAVRAVYATGTTGTYSGLF